MHIARKFFISEGRNTTDSPLTYISKETDKPKIKIIDGLAVYKSLCEYL
jgi:hypothetical protein